MPLFLSNFVQTIIMFFNIVGQGFTIEYCGRKMAQLSSTCFFVLQFYRILLLISVNGKMTSLFSILDKENKIATN